MVSKNSIFRLRRLTNAREKAKRGSRSSKSIIANSFQLEMLEDRLVLSSYTLSDNRWADLTRLTYSIAPDGVFWYHGTNQLNSVFSSKLGSSWQSIVAEAISQWSSVANIDVAQVPDTGGDGDWGGKAQGDPKFGDIRIGGYNFNDPITLALTAGPPPDGWTAAGDVQLNTGQNWNNGSDYDFYSVILHELGHSFGLEHPADANSIMYARYEGVRRSLDPEDIAGIQAIYGVRQPDSFNLKGQGTSFTQSIPVATPASGSRTASLAGLSLEAANAAEYIQVTIPQGFIGTNLVVTASAKGLSMLSPSLALLNADGSVAQTSSHPGVWGGTESVTLNAVQPGQTYRFLVQSAESSRFNIGSYSFKVEYQGGQVPAPPSSTPPSTTPGTGTGSGTGSGSGTTTPPATTPVTTPVTPPKPVVTPPISTTPTPTGVVNQPTTSPTTPRPAWWWKVNRRPVKKAVAPVKPAQKPAVAAKTTSAGKTAVRKA